jgi:hypothetical protein
MKRGRCVVRSIAQPTEDFEPSGCPLHHAPLPLDCRVLGLQLARRLLGRDALPRWDEWPESMIAEKMPKAQAVVALVS